MKKWILTMLPLVLFVLAFPACTAVESGDALPSVLASAPPSATPAPTTTAGTAPVAASAKTGPTGKEFPTAGSGLVKVSGVAKKVSDAMVLLASSKDGGEFMLRFSQNSKWDAGIDRQISVGNTVTCMVKLEPTFTTPSQGEVYEVLSNSHS